MSSTNLTSPPPPTTNFSIPLPKHRRTLSNIEPVEGIRNSSLQKIWAEDYFDSNICDTEPDNPGYGGGVGTGLGIDLHPLSPLPPATLTSRPFPRSVPISPDEESHPARQTRNHQRSLTALLPTSFLPRTARSISPDKKASPKKEKTRQEAEAAFMPTLTGDKDGVIKITDKSHARGSGIASWFSGSSAPVPLGIQIEQETVEPPTTMESQDSSPEQGGRLRKHSTLPTLDSNPPNINTTPSKPASSTTSRFNFFSSPKTPLKTNQTVQLPTSLNSDEFLTLDVTAALFPSGPPSPNDPFSPSSFKNLVINAEGIMLKLQTAYKLRTLSLHEVSAEKSAMSEELEEAETRAKALKSQLEEMAQKLSSADSAVVELATELAKEKRARAEEKEAREKSIALIKAHTEIDGVSIKDEDLGISRRRRKWRSSAGSNELSTEGESDNESGGSESVFSRSRSPTLNTGSSVTLESTPEIMQASFGRVLTHPAHHNPNLIISSLSTQTQTQSPTQRPKMVQQTSTFQKMLTGMNNSPLKEKDSFNGISGIGMGEEGCGNCRGQASSVAWDTVGLLRAENRGLKDRVGDLEGAVEGALDLVGGLMR